MRTGYACHYRAGLDIISGNSKFAQFQSQRFIEPATACLEVVYAYMAARVVVDRQPTIHPGLA